MAGEYELTHVFSLPRLKLCAPRARSFRVPAWIAEGKRGTTQANAFDPAEEPSTQRFSLMEYRKLDTR